MPGEAGQRPAGVGKPEALGSAVAQ